MPSRSDSRLACDIYYHRRFGQTVGKRAKGVRVVKTTGERID